MNKKNQKNFLSIVAVGSGSPQAHANGNRVILPLMTRRRPVSFSKRWPQIYRETSGLLRFADLMLYFILFLIHNVAVGYDFGMVARPVIGL